MNRKNKDNDRDKKEAKKERDLRQRKRRSGSSSVTQHLRRRSSSEQTLRYRIFIRPGGTQKSHTLRDFLPKPSTDLRQKIKQKSVRYEDQPLRSSDYDSHDAADFHIHATPFSTRESLVDLRRPLKMEPQAQTHNHHHHEDRKLHHHVRRCLQCLESKDDCICATLSGTARSSVLPRSNWSTLFQPEDKPKTWTSPRLNWLHKLENDSQVDHKKLLKIKFSSNREICCFPFYTFRLFAKRDVAEAEYYMKN